LFDGEVADRPFETRCLVVKTDPAKLLDQTRPVTRQWLRSAGDFIRCKDHGFLLGIIVFCQTAPRR
jgi:hypothetical protein